MDMLCCTRFNRLRGWRWIFLDIKRRTLRYFRFNLPGWRRVGHILWIGIRGILWVGVRTMKGLSWLRRFGFLLNCELSSILIQPSIKLQYQIARVYLIFEIILNILITIPQQRLIFTEIAIELLHNSLEFIFKVLLLLRLLRLRLGKLRRQLKRRFQILLPILFTIIFEKHIHNYY